MFWYGDAFSLRKKDAILVAFFNFNTKRVKELGNRQTTFVNQSCNGVTKRPLIFLCYKNAHLTVGDMGRKLGVSLPLYKLDTPIQLNVPDMIFPLFLNSILFVFNNGSNL